MSITVMGTVTRNWAFQERSTSGTLSPTGISIPVPISLTTSSYQNSGTGSGQCNLIYGEQLTLAASAMTFSLYSGMTDPLGNALVYARVREFVVQVVTLTPAHGVTVYATASDGWPFLPLTAHPITVEPGGLFALSDPVSTGSGVGMVVTASTYGFTIDPGANTVVVNLLVAGGDAV